MHTLKTVGGAQSLRSITARHASARVLDLHAIAEASGTDLDHGARPMFTHPVLNRTIIAKHHARPGDAGYSPQSGVIATKVIFPFDVRDLDLGGQYLFVHEPDLAQQLERHLDWRTSFLERDIAVLRALDRLPTLDPFLIREALSAQKVDVAPCYFRLSPADRDEMLEFVSSEVAALIELCFGKLTSKSGQTARLAALLLSDGDNPELEPLRLTMGMEGPEFREAMFCWKAILYYRWRSRILAPDLKETRRYVSWVDLGKFDSETASYIKGGIDRIEAMIADSQRKIAEAFRVYDAVFEALSVEKSPEPFRRFLKEGPTQFARLGERMGRLEQLISFWVHQFPDRRTRAFSPEAIFEGLRDLLGALSLTSDRGEGEADPARDMGVPVDNLRASRRGTKVA